MYKYRFFVEILERIFRKGTKNTHKTHLPLKITTNKIMVYCLSVSILKKTFWNFPIVSSLLEHCDAETGVQLSIILVLVFLLKSI